MSSTFVDLVDERSAVVAMLLNLDALPAGMELFPATNDDAWTLIQRVIDESDYYLLVVGGRYGSVDDESDLSYTEREFDYAVQQSKPVMAFLHGDPGKIPVEKTDQSDTAREKLDAFRAKVESAVHVNHWKSPGDLGGLVAASFMKIQKSHPTVGWVRGDVQTSTESLKELNDLRKRLEEAERQLDTARKEPPPGTEDLSHGSDKISVAVVMETMVQDAATYDVHYPPIVVDVVATWDAAFAAVGPELLDEASQGGMRKKLDAWFATEAWDRAEGLFATWIEENVSRVHERTIKRGTISDHDFDTLLLQFRALGLIVRSERKRSLKDTDTYWTLTPYGDEHLTTLRAIRRKQEDGD